MFKYFKSLVISILLSSLVFADDILLLDTSGSLSTPQVQKEITDIARIHIDLGKDVLGFSDNVYPIDSLQDVKFGGNTNLSAGLKEAYASNYDYVVLVTDGEPNSNEKTIQEAKLLKESGVKICSVFISDQSRVPLVLAKISDEIFFTSDIKESLKLCNADVRERLLSSGCDKRTVRQKEKQIRVETVSYKVKNCNSTSSFPVTVRTNTVEVK